jgi:hypothetical protein
MFGIDLGQLVLLKRNTFYVVTFRRFVTTDDYMPAVMMPVKVKLAHRATFIWVVIDKCVNNGQVTRELLLAIFRWVFGGVGPRESRPGEVEDISFDNVVGWSYLSGGFGPRESRQDEVEDISFNHVVGASYWQRFGRPFGQLHVGSVARQDVADYIAQDVGGSRLEQAKKRVASMSRKMIAFTTPTGKNIWFVTHFDWIKGDRIVFNEIRTWDPKSHASAHFYIDARIVDVMSAEDFDSELLTNIHATMDGKLGEAKLGILHSQISRLKVALTTFAAYISYGMPDHMLDLMRKSMDINRVIGSENLQSFELRLKPRFMPWA